MLELSLKNCPICNKKLVVTFSLRPDSWPTDKLYHICNFCDWEESPDVLKERQFRLLQLTFGNVSGTIFM